GFCAHPRPPPPPRGPAGRVFFPRHLSADFGCLSPTRYQPLGPGGLTMPAMWPPLLKTNRTGPETRLSVAERAFQGTVGAFSADTTEAGCLTSARLRRR